MIKDCRVGAKFVLLIIFIWFLPVAVYAAEVTRVVDGDTLEVQVNGAEETVRLIGVDTPETKHPTKPVQCFGQEASAEVARIAEGKQVRLERRSEENTDRYGRLLRYVYVKNGDEEIFVNQYLIREGFGYAYLEYPFDDALMDDFRQAETHARENDRGLWAQDTCAGQPTAVEQSPEKTSRSILDIIFELLEMLFSTL